MFLNYQISRGKKPSIGFNVMPQPQLRYKYTFQFNFPRSHLRWSLDLKCVFNMSCYWISVEKCAMDTCVRVFWNKSSTYSLSIQPFVRLNEKLFDLHFSLSIHNKTSAYCNSSHFIQSCVFFQKLFNKRIRVLTNYLHSPSTFMCLKNWLIVANELWCQKILTVDL